MRGDETVVGDDGLSNRCCKDLKHVETFAFLVGRKVPVELQSSNQLSAISMRVVRDLAYSLEPAGTAHQRLRCAGGGYAT